MAGFAGLEMTEMILVAILLLGFIAFDAGQPTYATVVLGVGGLGCLFIVLTTLDAYMPVDSAAGGGSVRPGQAAAVGFGDGSDRVRSFVESGPIELRRSFDGHFYTDLEVNGGVVRFVVDTGATLVVLSRRDAEKAGFDLEALRFSGQARTANGTVSMAMVTLDSTRLGGVRIGGVRAAVNGSDMDTSLLGMSYLQRYARMEIEGDTLRLTPK